MKRYIEKLEISGETKNGSFNGTIDFDDGLNIIHAENGFGKTLVNSGVGWCLGLEKMSVDADGDNAYFSEGARTSIELAGVKDIEVKESAAKLFMNLNNSSVSFLRTITPTGRNKEIEIASTSHSFKFNGKFKLGPQSLQSETSGFQSVLFQIFGWSPEKTRRYNGQDSFLYWENLGCLFFIDQLGGWTDIQSQQVRRYGILEVEQYAFEYSLGLKQHLLKRFHDQVENSAKKEFKEGVQRIYDRVNKLLQGSESLEELNVQGSGPDKIWERIQEFNVRSFLKSQVNLDVSNELINLMSGLKLVEARISDFSEKDKSDPFRITLDQIIALRETLEKVEGETSQLHLSHSEDKDISHRLEHKLRAAKDLLALKSDNLGLKSRKHSCPTCRQDVNPDSEVLGNLSARQVEVFIDTTSKEKKTLDQVIEKTEKELKLIAEKRKNLIVEIERAKKSLNLQRSITEAYKGELLRLFEAKGDFERKIEGIRKQDVEITEIEAEITNLKGKFEPLFEEDKQKIELKKEAAIIKKFEKKFKELLKQIDLSIFKIDRENIEKIKLDEYYRPTYNGKDLKNLGSASDQARIILPYVLALMDTALDPEVNGNHPGFVILDEPIQQNPDVQRRKSLIRFIAELKNKVRGQVLLFTHLHGDELSELKKAGVKLKDLTGSRFLNSTVTK